MRHVTITDEDLGIFKGRHSRRLTELEARLAGVLEDLCQGRDNAMSAADLAGAVFGAAHDQAKRNLRELVNHLITMHSHPICSMPGTGGGYWLPLSADEEEAVYQARKKRAMTGLVKMSRGRKAAYVESVVQMTLWFDDPSEADLDRLRIKKDNDPAPAWLKLVTHYLDQIRRHPDRYSAELEKLQQKYSPIFVPRSTVLELRQKAEDLGRLLKKIA